MKLIIGLGNPGDQYENTRHNAGFIVLDEIRKVWNFSEFQFNKKFNAEISESNKDGEKIILAKPQTFMNLSGQSVKAVADFYKISADDIAVIHDDLDIDLGAFKVSTDSSAAGHNGIQSIIDHFGTQKFKRVRLGIEGAELKKNRLMSGSDFVLQKFSDEELETIKNISKEIIKNLP
ncbi:MAG: hypothetical protein ACD_56C00060G0014 [uncultured bacterium]|nr:MAG: hypothetical protein ACD_56C00060G0014 [uncultured bacterium]